jgi:xylulose-5-phosphate/fructose-6-phosphate phosphoketolase
MAATLDQCVEQIHRCQAEARSGNPQRPRWPMIVLRSPKGWTAPREVDGHYLEGFWRAHQVPIAKAKSNAEDLRQLEAWMRSYKPEELFDTNGTLIEELRELTPTGLRRMGANPHANGGLLRKDLVLPDFRQYAVPVEQPATQMVENLRPLGAYLRDVMRHNMTNFRVFGPDETTSNKLDAIYEVSPKLWMETLITDDSDGGELSREGRVLEMLSENMMEGMLEGYVLTGRHGFWSTYESFAHVVDSMFNQHAKWLEICQELHWREEISSINMLITSTVWRQDHNGFTHQDPGFIDVVTNKSPSVTRIYLPPDANCLLSVADHCLDSKNYFNVIVSDKQLHLQYLDMDSAIAHCTKGIGIWPWASNDQGVEPDLVMACAGDISTQESLAATALLREHFPDLKVRFVNIVDLFRLMPATEHPHGLSDRDFDMLFTRSKPVILNFHGYPWLIHKLTYRRTNHPNIHVRGYKEKGSINTPLQLAIENNVDRYSLVMDAIDRVPKLQEIGAHTREAMRNQQIAAVQYAHAHGIDHPDYTNWIWPY